MDKMIYLAMGGAKEVMLRQATNSHNLANLSTNGFKADFDAMRSLPLYGPGQPSRVYSQAQSNGVDLSAGQMITTGRELDIAINGDGYIAVQDHDGSEAYTRTGDLHVNAAGLLETGAGYSVIGNDGGPIALSPFEKLEIGQDGTITIQPLGQSASSLAIVDRIKLVKLDSQQIEKTETGLLRQKEQTSAEPDASVALVSGVLEGSNVNPVEAMVTMIELSRQFEMQVKMMKSAEDNDTAATRLLQLG